MLGTGEDNRTVVLSDDVRRDLGTLVARHAPEVVVDIVRRFFAHHVVNRGVIGEFFHE